MRTFTLTADTIQTLGTLHSSAAERTTNAEEECVERARRGEREAIDWLVERHRDRAIRLAAHVLRRPADAEDVAQEAFVRVLRSLDSYRGDGAFSTWLYQVVVRICLDRRRLAGWSREAPLAAASQHTTSGEEETVLHRLQVEELLDRLSPANRAILVLREIEGLEYEEIARIMEAPIGRVRWRLHTARAKFQDLWRKSVQETEDV